MSAELKSLRAAGVEVRYQELGTGEPVLLLHGYPQNHACWRHQAAALARTHRVLVPDWFGWGASQRSLESRPQYPAEVERLGLLADALGLGRFNLAGHDYGGFLALGFAQRFPHRVARLAILNSRAHRTFTWPAFYRRTAAICYAARRAWLRGACARLSLHALHERDLRRYVPTAFSARELEGYIGWLRGIEGRRYLIHFYRYYEPEPRAHLTADLPVLTQPTTVIWGEHDRYCDAGIGRDLAARLPNGELTLIAEAGHFVMEENPQAVLTALQCWLARPTVTEPTKLGTEAGA